MNKDNISAALLGIAVISVIVGFAIYFNSPALNKGSSATQGQVEKFISAAERVTKVSGSNMTTTTTIKLDKSKFDQLDKSQFRKAPEFVQISGYINTNHGNPIKLSELKNKVVLLDFWTYSCINCIRTIPYLNDWNQEYADKGLVIVGVHSPEFEFEKNIDNVKTAVHKFGIKYPVLMDSDHGTWNAFQNQYWPRHYLIDTEGYIRQDHIGEGGYAETEKAIQLLLAERAAQMGMKEISFSTKATAIIKPGSLQSIDLTKNTTPEIYLGYAKAASPLGNPQGFLPNQIVSYSISSNTDFKPNIVYLDGKWKNNPDNVELQGETGRIILTYFAKAVNIVAGGKGQVGLVKVVTGDSEGAVGGASPKSKISLGVDLSQDGKFTIDGQRLYNLALHDSYRSHSIIIDVKGKGFQLYTFTFG
jgi:thiol-disulfide isomerase/thioredoxin